MDHNFPAWSPYYSEAKVLVNRKATTKLALIIHALLSPFYSQKIPSQTSSSGYIIMAINGYLKDIIMKIFGK